MLTLLLAAAVAAAPQCDDFAGSSPYQVTNVTQMGVMGFTTEGEGVVAMCVGPVDDGRVQLLDAFKGNVKEVTEAKCANYMVVTGQDVATMGSEGISSEAPVMFVPLKGLNGSLPVQSEVKYSGESVNCLVSNGVSITAVCYSTTSPLGPYVQTIDNQGHTQFPFNASNSVSSATVSKQIGNSFGYYVATWNQPETSDSYIYVYSCAGSVLHTYTLIPGTLVLAMRFRDEANTLVVVCVSHTAVYDLKTGTNKQYSHVDWYAKSAVINDDGSQVAISGSQGAGVKGTPLIYTMDLYSGVATTLCEQKVIDRSNPEMNYATLSYFAVDPQGRGVVLSSQYTSPSDRDLKVHALRLPQAHPTNVPATSAPAASTPVPGSECDSSSSSVPIGAIIGVIAGAIVALVVGGGVGFWLGKRQAAPPLNEGSADSEAPAHPNNYVSLPTAVN